MEGVSEVRSYIQRIPEDGSLVLRYLDLDDLTDTTLFVDTLILPDSANIHNMKAYVGDLSDRYADGRSPNYQPFNAFQKAAETHYSCKAWLDKQYVQVQEDENIITLED